MSGYGTIVRVPYGGGPTGSIRQSPASKRSPCISSEPSRRRAGVVPPLIRYSQFGSTTNHVIREAACPVLTLRG